MSIEIPHAPLGSTLPVGCGRKLNSDVELLVIKAVFDSGTSRSSDLSALSLVCSEFYGVVAPRRWRHVKWPKVKAVKGEAVGRKTERIIESLPTSILGLIRNLYLFHEQGIHSSVENSGASWVSLTKSLADMSNLEAVAFNLPTPPPVFVLDTLYALPNLRTFESMSTPLHFPLTMPHPTSIRRLVLQGPIAGLNIDNSTTGFRIDPIIPFTMGFTSDPTSYLPRDNHAQHQFERSLRTSRAEEERLFAHSIVCATLQDLHHLELDIELFDFDVLGEARFPNLGILIFHGTSSASSSYSLLKLKGMRALREINFVLSIPPNSPSNYHVLPPLPDEYSLRATVDLVSELFPELQVFRTSNPVPDDTIYHALPDTVRGIHFKSIIPAMRPPTVPHTGAMDEPGLVKILEALRKRQRRSITDLSIILQVVLTPTLLSSIVGTLPDLETLQIKAPFIDEGVGQSAFFSVTDYTDALRPLRNLEHLRLSLRSSGIHSQDGHGSMHEPVDPREHRIIKYIAKELSPSLHTIGLYRQFSAIPGSYRIRSSRAPVRDYVGWCDYHIVRKDGKVWDVRPSWPKSLEETREKTHWLHSL